MKNNTLTKVRFYSKSELAKMYGVSPQTFSKWLLFAPDLYNSMEALGYETGDKLFSPNQMRLMPKYFGQKFQFNPALNIPVKIYSFSSLQKIYKIPKLLLKRYISKALLPETIKQMDEQNRNFLYFNETQLLFDFIGKPAGLIY